MAVALPIVGPIDGSVECCRVSRASAPARRHKGEGEVEGVREFVRLLDHGTRSLERAFKHLDVACQHSGHARWSAFVGIGDHRAEIGQFLGHFGVGQGLVEGA